MTEARAPYHISDAALIRESVHSGDMARSWPDVVQAGCEMALGCWCERGEPEQCEERCFANWYPVGCPGKGKSV